MSTFKSSLPSGLYATMRAVFTTLRNDQILCKYLYYPSDNMDDDPTMKPDVTSEQKDEIIYITKDVDELEGSNKIKRGRLTFGLGTIYKSYQNHKASSPIIIIYIFVPRVGFQNIDFRQEAILDRIDELISDRKFEGSFGRVFKDGGNPYDAPKGYLGYTVRYEFADTDF